MNQNEPQMEVLPPIIDGTSLTGHDINELLQLLDEQREAFPILDLPKIKAPSGGSVSFLVTLATGEEENVKTVTGIMLAHRMARILYKSRGGAGKKPPDCVSKDGFAGVGDPGGDCLKCPFARFGSSINPDGSAGTGQACKDVRQILFLLEGQSLPHLFNLPPTSIKNFNSYSMVLLNRRAPAWGAITKLSLERATSSSGIDYAKVRFTLERKLEPHERTLIQPYHQAMRDILSPSVVDASVYQIEDEAPHRAPLAPPEPSKNYDDVPF